MNNFALLLVFFLKYKPEIYFIINLLNRAKYNWQFSCHVHLSVLCCSFYRRNNCHFFSCVQLFFPQPTFARIRSIKSHQMISLFYLGLPNNNLWSYIKVFQYVRYQRGVKLRNSFEKIGLLPLLPLFKPGKDVLGDDFAVSWHAMTQTYLVWNHPLSVITPFVYWRANQKFAQLYLGLPFNILAVNLQGCLFDMVFAGIYITE